MLIKTNGGFVFHTLLVTFPVASDLLLSCFIALDGSYLRSCLNAMGTLARLNEMSFELQYLQNAKCVALVSIFPLLFTKVY